jgi:hypothetical protein
MRGIEDCRFDGFYYLFVAHSSKSALAIIPTFESKRNGPLIGFFIVNSVILVAS